MPKYEIDHIPGHPISPEIRQILERYFSLDFASKMERLGGRITIAVTSPRQPKKINPINIDLRFIEELSSAHRDFAALKGKLDALSVKQLKQVCALINLPVPSNALAGEIRRNIIHNLQSEDYWQRISSGGN